MKRGKGFERRAGEGRIVLNFDEASSGQDRTVGEGSDGGTFWSSGHCRMVAVGWFELLLFAHCILLYYVTVSLSTWLWQ
jgi:hypothetical protein